MVYRVKWGVGSGEWGVYVAVHGAVHGAVHQRVVVQTYTHTHIHSYTHTLIHSYSIINFKNVFYRISTTGDGHLE